MITPDQAAQMARELAVGQGPMNGDLCDVLEWLHIVHQLRKRPDIDQWVDLHTAADSLDKAAALVLQNCEREDA